MFIINLFINEQIRDSQVRLVDFDGTQLGIVSNREAQERAIDKKLDLVKIAPEAKPPVCKIMDYSKYRYELIKKEKEARKNQKIIVIKEIRLSASIEKHDIEVKIKHAISFLKSGHKVKLSVRLRGRELGHTENAKKIINDFISSISEYGIIEKNTTFEMRSLFAIISPKVSFLKI